jgi:hypothetical protein
MALYWLTNRVPFVLLAINLSLAAIGIPVAISFLDVDASVFVDPLIFTLLAGQIVAIVLLQKGFRRPTAWSIAAEFFACTAVAAIVISTVAYADFADLAFVEGVEKVLTTLSDPPTWAIISIAASVAILAVVSILKYRTYRLPTQRS